MTYAHPRERVLFNAARDANPFFALYESLWMLAGRDDVAPLAYYCSRMKEFSDDGSRLNGAYGSRWRSYPRRSDEDECEEGPVDQLNLLVEHLKANPDSRRAVLQMWNVEDGLLKVGESKDVCCNLSVLFVLRRVNTGPGDYGDEWITYLDMTVLNRSNDLVWGLTGANAVHFAFLQEYLAARLRVEVGVYRHFTNNLHVYTSNWKPEEWLKEGTSGLIYNGDGYWRGVALVRDPEVFERELPDFVESHKGPHGMTPLTGKWSEPFLKDVADPLLTAFHFHKSKAPAMAIEAANSIPAGDWRIAATAWLKRRQERRGLHAANPLR